MLRRVDTKSVDRAFVVGGTGCLRRSTRTALALLAATLLLGVTGRTRAEIPSKPNIVFILADDLGYGDLACYGRKDIRTPNLDSLARQGVRFTAHYANGAECTPTRTAFLTGRYQQWVGGLECAIGTGNVGRYDDAKRLSDRHDLGLPTSLRTLPRMLKDAGYQTAITGKWHLGYEPKFAPHLHGFDYTFYCIGGGMDYFHYLDNLAYYNLFRDGNPVSAKGYFTDLATDEAMRFIRSRDRSRPFFLYLPYTSPHSPFQGPDDWRRDPLPLESPLWNQGKAPPETYIAMIEHMDRRIGDLLKLIDGEGLGRQTLVIFASDNGGTRSARNEPLSGIKGMTFEGGIRVPAMARWPDVIPAGTVSDQVCITFDFTASIVAAAGATPSPQTPLEGMDIVRHVAEGRGDVKRKLFWRKPRGDTVWMAARDGNLKYVAKRKGDRLQEYLFDIAADIGEKHDLKATRRADFERLRRDYRKWEWTVRAGRRGRPEGE